MRCLIDNKFHAGWHWNLAFKKTFYPDNSFYLICMMLQINKTKHVLNLTENVFLCNFKKVEFPQISNSFFIVI